MRSVGVFVYGDIGRSPRMQNHAVELSKMYQVYFMGYFDTAPKSKVVESPNIKIVDLQIKNLQFFRAISYYLYVIIRIILQILQILYYMGWKYRNLDFILVQVNYPSFRILLPCPTSSPFGWLPL
jgi:beta-1,4-mannosyltransferase